MSTRKRALILAGAGVLCLGIIIAAIVAVAGSRNKLDEETRHRLIDVAAGLASGQLDEFEAWLEMRDVIRASQHRTGNYSREFEAAAEKEWEELAERARKRRRESGR